MDTGDNELIKCIKEGDLKAFEKVFKDYYALMCSVAMDYVNDSAMCQTLTEDVLLNLWEKKNELVITTSLRAYLFVPCATNVSTISGRSVRIRIF